MTLLTLAFALALAPSARLALAQPQDEAAAPSAKTPSAPRLNLSVQPGSISPTGTVTLVVSGTTKVPIASLEVRFRITRPSGHLLFQRTLTAAVPAGAVNVRVVKSFAGIDLREGRCLVDARVTADSRAPATLHGRLFIIKPGRAPVPVVIVPRFVYSPSTDPEGRFVIDPATATRSRDDLMALTGMLERQPGLRMSLGMPPIQLDDWRRILDGYEVASQAGEGVRSVSKDAPAVATYINAVQALKNAASGGRLDLLDVPFADPDLSGLAQMGAMRDLRDHLDRGSSIYQASLAATPVAGAAVLGDAVSQTAARVLRTGRLNWALLRPDAVKSKTATAPPGVYLLTGTRMRGVVLDQTGSRILESRDASLDVMLDHVFARLTSTSATQPLVMTVRLGPGAPTDVSRLEAVLAELGHTGWVRFESANAAAKRKPAGTVSLKDVPPGPPAPAGYWDDVGRARISAHAYVTAVGERDSDADAALYQALVAESRSWAGADGSWSLADRGRAFAAASQRRSDDVLGKVSASSSKVTLSGFAGEVPIDVRNESGKTLQVALVPSGSEAAFPGGRVRASLRPGVNNLKVPVDLGRGGIYDRVTVRVVAGELTLATTTLDVQASYLDRLVLVGAVAVLLAGLLIYIRRKVRAAEADTK